MDDGKSTLIGRLLHDSQAIYADQLAAVSRDSARFGTTGAGRVDLALLTDGLKAEREQGITIDVAYRYFSTDRRSFIIADTPGHEQYTRNMATGASTCRLAIILIDARHGVVTQTRRHSFIASLLGIRHFVVAVNKMDLVGYAREAFEGIVAEYSAFVAALGVPDVHCIPISALHGDNVVARSEAMTWYPGPPLLTHLETVPIGEDEAPTGLRLPVQYVIRPSPDFRGIAGTIASGILRRDDEVVVLPWGRRSRITSIVTYDGERAAAFASMAVTLTLADDVDVSRGDMLVHADDAPSVANRVEAMVVWMADTPLTSGRSYWIKQTTRSVPGRVTELRHRVDVNTLEKRPASQLGLNEIGQVVLTLDRPIAFDPYATHRGTGAFIIIDRVTNDTAGAGMILAGTDWQADSGRRAPESASLMGSRTGTLVAEAEREARLGQKAATVLLFAADAPGPLVFARALERRLFDAGVATALLDGSDPRHGVGRDLDVIEHDCSETLRRAIEVARLMNDAGLVCICAVDGPWAKARDTARPIVGAERLVSVALTASPEEVPGADLVVPPDASVADASMGLITALLVRRRLIG